LRSPIISLLSIVCALDFAVTAAMAENRHTAHNAMRANQIADIDRMIASVLPRPDEERWQTIPWYTSLMQARVAANELHRPIFLWIMNGHPFGCT
jgi:hypothetical protein